MLLGPLVLLLRASGIATNLQFLHAKQKEAGAYGSSYPPYAMKLRYDEGGVD